jgi:hypothetical protein
MTTTTLPRIPFTASTSRTPLLRAGAPALLLGGPLAMVFHVLYGLGHGPTVVNEHGVVLGLTNDQWSQVGVTWRVLVLVGVLAVGALHTSRLARTATGLLVAGLVMSVVATWIWPLYAVATLLEFSGLACLAVAVVREGVLPRWAGRVLWLPVVAFLPLPLAPEAVISAEWTVRGFLLQSEDLIAAAVALAWSVLGLGLARASRPASQPV